MSIDLSIVESRAKSDFANIPFPTKKDEFWRFAKLDAWNVDSLFPFFTSATTLSSNSFLKEQENNSISNELVFSDSLQTFKDLPENARSISLQEASSKYPELLKRFFGLAQGKFDVLCSSRANIGRFIEINADCSLDLSFISKLPMSASNYVFKIADKATLKLSRKFLTFGGAFNAMRFAFFLGKDSHLELDTLDANAENSRRWTREDFFVEENAKIIDALAVIGSDYTRTERNFYLEGKGANVDSRAFVRANNQVVHDIRTLQHHTSPEATSNIAVKAALDGESKLAFSGLIKVEENAQKTASYQSARSLLLSNKARAQASPILEILANDVSCSHGCTVAKPDENEIFYMMSRGLNSKDALKLLTQGFAASVFEKFQTLPKIAEFI